MTNPGAEADNLKWRPGRQGHGGSTDVIRRAWEHPEEDAKVVDATDNDKTLVLACSVLNGLKIALGSFVWFISAAVRSDSNKEALKHPNTTLWLGCVLSIVKKIVDTRPYVHFILAYRSKHGNIRVIACAPHWIHAPVPEQFQALLTLDKEAAALFSVADSQTAEMSTTCMAKLMKRSSERVRRPAPQPATIESSNGNASSSSSSADTALQELVAVKAELKSLLACKEEWKKEIKSMEQLTKDTLSLHEDERKEKLKLQAQLNASEERNKEILKQLREAKEHGTELEACLSSLQEDCADIKKKAYNVERVGPSCIIHFFIYFICGLC